jgi:hypothetical protein
MHPSSDQAESLAQLALSRAGGDVKAVAATAPLVSTGGTHPVLSITPATDVAPGSMSAADKAKLDAIGAVVSAVGATAPITSSGGATPTIGITPATDVAAGSMSSADKAKLDAIGSVVSAVGATAPITSSGGATPTIGITPATDVAPGSMSAADKAKLDAINGSSLGFGPYSARPAAGHAGARYLASDGLVEFVDDGTAWRPMLRGVPGTEVAPGNSIAAFTQVGHPPTHENVQGGCFYMFRLGGDGDQPGGYEVPRTGTQTFTVHIVPQIFPTEANNQGQVGVPGIWVRDTAGGHLIGIRAMTPASIR